MSFLNSESDLSRVSSPHPPPKKGYVNSNTTEKAYDGLPAKSRNSNRPRSLCVRLKSWSALFLWKVTGHLQRLVRIRALVRESDDEPTELGQSMWYIYTVWLSVLTGVFWSQRRVGLLWWDRQKTKGHPVSTSARITKTMLDLGIFFAYLASQTCTPFGRG